MSDLVEARQGRMGIPWPDTRNALRVYDSGGTQLYHTRPQTPYQR
jgi:hypothetical protein